MNTDTHGVSIITCQSHAGFHESKSMGLLLNAYCMRSIIVWCLYGSPIIEPLRRGHVKDKNAT